MEKQQKKRIQKYISWGLLGAMVVLLACMPLIAAGKEETEGPQASILSGKAERKDISLSLVGGGTLTSREAVEITIPADVKLTRYLVGNGDFVEEGAPIAGVDRVTVMTAITQVQQTLAHLSEKIEEVREERASDQVTALTEGTVKQVYAREGDDVQEVMLRNGALAVLSLDGLMAVRIDRNTELAVGDKVCVTLSSGKETEGSVESNLNGILTVTIVDEDYAVGEKASVTTLDGNRIGSGQLYIHSQWDAVAYSGTVSRVRVREGQTVSPGHMLMRLEDTDHTAEYYRLTDQYREYEAWMLTLFQMYQSKTVTAPCAGVVTGVDTAGTYMLRGGEGWTLSLLANAPNGEDDTTYVNYIGQVAAVGLDGLVMKMNPQPLNIADYKDLSGVPTDPALMTEDAIYTDQAPLYELAEGEWLQAEASSVVPGDILLFAGDETGSFVWVVRIARREGLPEDTEPETPSESTEPTEPEEPADQEQPEAPSEPTVPSETHSPSENGSSQEGNGGHGTMQPQEEEDMLYALETVNIASVTPQEELLLEITLDELDITKVSEGQEAQIMVNALNGEVFDAAVSRIANAGENNGGNSKFIVELTLEKRGDMLPGMSASAVIPLEVIQDCVTVPVAVLTETGTETLLYRSYDAETGEPGNPVTVTVGASDGENAQILSGIQEGETYFYPYYDTPVISNVPEQGRFSFGK